MSAFVLDFHDNDHDVVPPALHDHHDDHNRLPAAVRLNDDHGLDVDHDDDAAATLPGTVPSHHNHHNDHDDTMLDVSAVRGLDRLPVRVVKRLPHNWTTLARLDEREQRLSFRAMVGDVLQPTHLLFVLVIALLVLGPKRLPEVGRSLGRGLRDFRQALNTDMAPNESESIVPPPSVTAPPAMTPVVSETPAPVAVATVVSEEPVHDMAAPEQARHPAGVASAAGEAPEAVVVPAEPPVS